MKGLIFLVFVAMVVYASSELEVVCPKPITGEISAAPHPCNCSVYYECKDGEKTVKMCPPPFTFNQEAQICDWPTKSKCKIEPACLDSCKCTFSY